MKIETELSQIKKSISKIESELFAKKLLDEIEPGIYSVRFKGENPFKYHKCAIGKFTDGELWFVDTQASDYRNGIILGAFKDILWRIGSIEKAK